MSCGAARMCALAISVLLTAGASCTVSDSKTQVVFHSAGQASVVSQDSSRLAIVALIGEQLASASQIRLAITDSLLARLRSGAALEVTFASARKFRTEGGGSIKAQRILVPIEGEITNGASGSRTFVAVWGLESYASGPYTAANAADVLVRLRELASAGIR